MKIAILGSPASGKGTQGELLGQKLKLPRLSVGALVRRHCQEKTPEGLVIEQYMLKGLAIPADVYMKLVGTWLVEHPDGFVVDNLIRSQDQLNAYDIFAKETNFSLDFVFDLLVSEEEARKRLSIRKLVKDRPDETPEAIHERFRTYKMHIPTIASYFRKQGIYHEIDAYKPVEVVNNEMYAMIVKKKESRT